MKLVIAFLGAQGGLILPDDAEEEAERFVHRLSVGKRFRHLGL